MKMKDTIKELYQLLQPFVKEHPQKKDTVTEENVEDLIILAKGYNVEEKVLAYVKAHPDAVFWDFLQLIPEGLAPGDDGSDLLADDD